MIFLFGMKSLNYHPMASKFHLILFSISFIHTFRYVAVTVDHFDDIPCSGRFILHQGIQRRIGITLCHETSTDLIWKNVREVVVGM
jgi:hypothetical protein